jgi:hypothetical protein
MQISENISENRAVLAALIDYARHFDTIAITD